MSATTNETGFRPGDAQRSSRNPMPRRAPRSAMVSSPEVRAREAAETERLIAEFLARGKVTACPDMPASGSHFSPVLGTDL